MSVRLALLGLLAQEPCHGYELLARFTAIAGGRDNWEVKPAQVYTTLIRMEEVGLVESQTDQGAETPQKRIFSLTPAGHEELMNWFRSPADSEPQQDPFFLKLMLSLNLDEVDASRLIKIQRSALYQELHRVTQARQNLDSAIELAQILLMDKAAMHLEADLRWLDMVEARLDEVKEQPPPKPDLKSRGRPPGSKNNPLQNSN